MDSPHSLTELIGRVEEAPEHDGRTTLDEILDTLGERAFGPLLVLAGLVAVAPFLGDLPGASTLIGVFVLLVSGQLLLGREQPWLPAWLLDMSVKTRTLVKTMGWLHRPARFVDGLLRPRLGWIVRGTGRYVIAGFSIAIAATMPFMEVVPFSANVAGLALVVLGLSLLVGDGLVAMLGLLFTGGALGMVVYTLFF